MASVVAVRAAASPLPIPPNPHSKPTTIPSSSSSSHSLRPPPLNLPKKRNQQQQQQQQKPSIAEIERAIGVATDPISSSSSSSSSSQPFMEFLASTPIGQAESPAERKLREAAEWVVERTEARASNGQRILMMVCLKILPVWILLLLVAFGVLRLPFNIPFVDDLLS